MNYSNLFYIFVTVNISLKDSIQFFYYFENLSEKNKNYALIVIEYSNRQFYLIKVVFLSYYTVKYCVLNKS